MGMLLMPRQQWGLVVKGYKVLYPKNQPYTDQLRALEKACKDQPANAAPRFLLGYHYLYLGFPKDAEIELNKALQLAPDDQFTERLLAVATGISVAAVQRLTPSQVPQAPAPSPTDGTTVTSDPASVPAPTGPPASGPPAKPAGKQ